MKKQFLHEAHRRQEKALKPDYREAFWHEEHTAAVSSRSGSASQALVAKGRARLLLLETICRWHFVYDGWVYQPGFSFRQFATINRAPVWSLQVFERFAAVSRACEQDLPKLRSAIKSAEFKVLRGFLAALVDTNRFYLDWKIPDDATVEQVSRNLPKDVIRRAVARRRLLEDGSVAAIPIVADSSKGNRTSDTSWSTAPAAIWQMGDAVVQER